MPDDPRDIESAASKITIPEGPVPRQPGAIESSVSPKVV